VLEAQKDKNIVADAISSFLIQSSKFTLSKGYTVKE